MLNPVLSRKLDRMDEDSILIRTKIESSPLPIKLSYLLATAFVPKALPLNIFALRQSRSADKHLLPAV